MQLAFKDADPKIILARQAAYNYLHIHLKGHRFGVARAPSQTLEETVERDLLPPDHDENMSDVFNGLQQRDKSTTYDPDAEARDNEEAQRAEKKKANGKKLKEIVEAVQILADTSIAELSTESIKQIKLALANASEFLAGTINPEVSADAVDSRENVAHSEEIAKRIEANRFRGAKPKEAMKFVELPPGEPAGTHQLLCYIRDQLHTDELAVGNLLAAVNTINAAFDGRSHGHYR